MRLLNEVFTVDWMASTKCMDSQQNNTKIIIQSELGPGSFICG